MKTRVQKITHVYQLSRALVCACALVFFCIVAETAAGPGKKLFSFLQVSDLHVTDTTTDDLLHSFVAMTNSLAPYVDFVVVTGDLGQNVTNIAEVALAKSILDQLTMPYYAIKGNHDPKLSEWRAVFGAENSVVDYMGYRLLLLHSESTIPQTTLAFVDSVLSATAAAQPIIGFTHHPLSPEVKYDASNGAALLGKFSAHNLTLWLSGHWHGNSGVRADGVPLYTVCNLAMTRGNEDPRCTDFAGYFRLVNVWEDSVDASKMFGLAHPPAIDDFELDNTPVTAPLDAVAMHDNERIQMRVESGGIIHVRSPLPCTIELHNLQGQRIASHFIESKEVHLDMRLLGAAGAFVLIASFADNRIEYRRVVWGEGRRK